MFSRPILTKFVMRFGFGSEQQPIVVKNFPDFAVTIKDGNGISHEIRVSDRSRAYCVALDNIQRVKWARTFVLIFFEYVSARRGKCHRSITKDNIFCRAIWLYFQNKIDHGFRAMGAVQYITVLQSFIWSGPHDHNLCLLVLETKVYACIRSI